jgi:biotin carboxyl carrier protein
MVELVVVVGEREERVSVEQRGGSVDLRIGDRAYRVDVAQRGSLLSLVVDGRQVEVVVTSSSHGEYRVSGAESAVDVQVRDPLTHLASTSRGGTRSRGTKLVRAYMPGRVVSLLIQEGDTVEAGQGILVLEAMKMENEIQTELAGVVERLFVTAGQAVEAGDPLFEVA